MPLDAWASDQTPDPDLAARAVALGQRGCGRDEIAARLGLMMAELIEREAADAGFADAMVRAEAAARAWWAAELRLALAAGVRMSASAWREAMVATFSDEAAGAAAPAGSQPPQPPPARFEFPDNGTRRRPDGTAPCDDPVWDRMRAIEAAIERARDCALAGEPIHEDETWRRRIAALMGPDELDDDDDAYACADEAEETER